MTTRNVIGSRSYFLIILIKTSKIALAFFIHIYQV